MLRQGLKDRDKGVVSDKWSVISSDVGYDERLIENGKWIIENGQKHHEP